MPREIKKGWGHEVIIESNDTYCMKQLCFYKKGHKSSFHFHKEKEETWLIQSGSVQVEIMDMRDSATRMEILKTGDTLHLKPMTPHQVTSLEDNTVILEASSKDTPEDNYRIAPGDSQKRQLDIKPGDYTQGRPGIEKQALDISA
jgi:mannose-6-phosphate isomerase-like protein (cupin superfamily)